MRTYYDRILCFAAKHRIPSKWSSAAKVSKCKLFEILKWAEIASGLARRPESPVLRGVRDPTKVSLRDSIFMLGWVTRI